MIKEELKRGKNVSVRFAVVSDTHMTHIREGYEPFEKTMKIISELSCDAIVFAGDLAYMIEKAGGGICKKLYPKAYDLVNEVLDKYLPDMTKIYAIGNHEYPQGNHDEELCMGAIKLFEEKTGHKMNEHTTVGGYHFITMGGYPDNCIFSEETESWAMEEIDSAIAEDDKKPVFIVFHKPPHNTVIGSVKEAGMMSENFRSFLNQRKQIINIVGDLHTPAQEPKTIWQDGFTVIHSPMNAVGYIVFHGCDIRIMNTYDKYSQALLFDIEDDSVNVYRLDTIENEAVGDMWTIDVTDKENWRYTDKRFDVEIIPYFEKGTELSVEYKDGSLGLSVKDAMCEPNDIESFAEYYNIKVKDNKGTEVLAERISSDYHFVNRSGVFKYLKDIELKGSYTVEITPESSFYKKGKAIVQIFEA